LWRWDRPLAIAVLVLSGGAAALAVAFALTYKPHVLLHMAAAYGLIGVLLISYGIAYRAGRRLLALIYWLTMIAFVAVLCFIHLDDEPPRPVYDESLERPHLVQRPEVPYLDVAVGLDVAWAALLTLHALGVQMRRPVRGDRGDGGDGDEGVKE
jgi:hypothetical protein